MSQQTVENVRLIRPSLLLLLCAAGIVLAAAQPCEAALQLELELVGTNNQFQPDNISLDVNSAPGQTDLGDDNYLRNSYGTAWGSVSYGAMRLYAESQVFAVPDSASFGTRKSEAFATVTDAITIAAPGGPATATGTFYTSIRIGGSHDPVFGGHASDPQGFAKSRWEARVRADGSEVLSKEGEEESTSSGNREFGDPFGTYAVAVPFTFGTSLNFQFTIRALATGFNPGGVGFTRSRIDMGNTIQLLGIHEVRDANGNLILMNELTISSDSGTDYTQPATLPPAVPEPASALLLALLGGAVLRRRRQPKRNANCS